MCSSYGAADSERYQAAKSRVPYPDIKEVADILQNLLPDHILQVLDVITRISIADMVKVLEGRGCALLQIKADPFAIGALPVCWIWMVGVETRHYNRTDGERQSSAAGEVQALLVVGPQCPAPWGSGFGAKVYLLEDGTCQLRSVDGQLMQGRLAVVSVLKPGDGDTVDFHATIK